jgi:hypothetical protein
LGTVLVVTHAHDRFHQRQFLLKGLFGPWEAAGHRVIVREGPGDLPPADVAILHVDRSEVPREYLVALRAYPLVVNRAVVDIRKRTFSQQLVVRGDGYDGPVIVKTDRNSGGVPEALNEEASMLLGNQAGPRVRFMKERYPIFDAAHLVPGSVWNDPELVVEKFTPEKEPRGYCLRVWVFFGSRWRCSKVIGAHPVVKAADAIERVPVPVPDELWAWRERLGFDYGKFDFVLHEGRPVLLDVNRTPTSPPKLSDAMRAGSAALSEGIEAFLR